MNDTLARLSPKLRAVAVNVAPGSDSNLHDDLVQEMAVAILECGEGHSESFYLRRAADRARDYLRRERRQPASFTDVGLDEHGAKPRTHN